MNVAGNNFNTKKVNFKGSSPSDYMKDRADQLGKTFGNFVKNTNRDNSIEKDRMYYTLGAVGGGALATSEMVINSPKFTRNAKGALKSKITTFSNIDLTFGRATEKFAKKFPKSWQGGVKRISMGCKNLLFKSAAVGAVIVFAANLFLILTNAFAKKAI